MLEFFKEGAEGQPEGHIQVFGFGKDPQRFSSMTDAVEWISQGKQEYSMLQFPMEIGIQGSLSGDKEGDELLTLTLGEKTVSVPRAKGNSQGIVVSTDYGFMFNLCIPVGEYDEPVLDRGIAWVSLGDPTSATMKIGIRSKHGQTSQQLMERVSSAEIEATNYLRKVMDGFIPPFPQ